MNSAALARTVQDLQHLLTAACDHYETSAPTVHAWADDLFQRIDNRADEVRLTELLTAAALHGPDGWEHPNYAANRVYKLMHRLGQDTTGQAGF